MPFFNTRSSMSIFINCYPIFFYYIVLTDIRCESPGEPSNGQRQGNDFSFGSTVKFTCNDGYTINGEETLKCVADGEWNHPRPKCDSKSYLHIQVIFIM